MIKIVLSAASGKQVDLFPESNTVREVLKQFGTNAAGMQIVLNGETLREEELDCELRAEVKGSDAWISVYPKPVECPAVSAAAVSSDDERPRDDSDAPVAFEDYSLDSYGADLRWFSDEFDRQFIPEARLHGYAEVLENRLVILHTVLDDLELLKKKIQRVEEDLKKADSDEPPF